MIEYNQNKYVTPDGWVFSEFSKGMYGLTQSGILAHNKLKKLLQPHGYTPVTHTQDYGSITHSLSRFLLSLMILVSST